MDYVELPIDATIKKIIEDRKNFTKQLVDAYKQGLITQGIEMINNDLRLEEINLPRRY